MTKPQACSVDDHRDQVVAEFAGSTAGGNNSLTTELLHIMHDATCETGDSGGRLD